MDKWKRTRRVYVCSFCGKNQDQVQRLIAGPGGVYVCDECVEEFSKVRADVDRQEGSDSATKTKKARVANRCSFCGKNYQQVLLLHSGSDRVKICNECVSLCQEIIEEEQSVTRRPD